MGKSIASYWWINNITWSSYVYTGSDWVKILIDMWWVQWYKTTVLDNMKTGIPDWELEDINAAFVTHAHYDHCGRLPLLVKEWYRWSIYLTQKTAEAVITTLNDSLIIAERESGFIIKKKLSDLQKTLNDQHRFVTHYSKDILSGKYNFDDEINKRIEKALSKKLVNVETTYLTELSNPLESLNKYIKNLDRYNIKTAKDIAQLKIANSMLPWTELDLQKTIERFEILDYGETVSFSENIDVTFYDAGHILWSAQVLIRDALNGNILFSWDLWRLKDPLYLSPPHLFTKKDKIDTMVIESTYGAKEHRDRNEENVELLKLIAETEWPILRADFANQRHTDDLQTLLEWQSKYTFMPEIVADGVTAKTFLWQRIGQPWYEYLTDNLRKIVRAPKDHNQKVESIKNKKVIIVSSSGMISAWPITAYLHEILSNPKALLVIPGFQAAWTVWERILNKMEYTFNGQVYPVKSNVYHCKGKSSHAWQDDLHQILESASPRHTVIVHGPEEWKKALSEWIVENNISKKVTIPTEEWKEYRL